MKIKIPFDYDQLAQKELGVELDIPERNVQSVIRTFLLNLDYNDRQKWIHTNVPNKNVKHITEKELYE